MSAVASESIMLSCRGLWKVFGLRPGHYFDTTGCQIDPEALVARLRQEGHILAVADATFDVRKGEIFVIMGISGPGKSTLVRCLSRLPDIGHGVLEFEGRDLSRISGRELTETRRRKMRMVFKSFGLMPHLTALENVAFPLKLQGIARSLAPDPELWFLDEPFSALDPLIRRQMQDAFLRLQRQLKKSIIFIAHDIMEACRLADRIALMPGGQIIQIGTPAEILLSPADDHVAGFTAEVALSRAIRVRDQMTPGGISGAADGPGVAPEALSETLLPDLASGQRKFAVAGTRGMVLESESVLAVLRRDASGTEEL